ncbi:DUF5597 domain-containing protein [bacterium]|nr:DUF5597 domain-containing protein [bacterium]
MQHRILIGLVAAGVALWIHAQSADPPLPHLEQNNGRHALIVDGEPYLILGAQCNNSSAWPAMLPKVWTAMEALHVNTLEIPVYWEQFEPEPGQYDYHVIDTIIMQAREHDLRLILLWFATWKNGSNHYMPQWMKLQPGKYPNITGKNGRQVDSPSPHARAALEADIRAFSAFMHHLREADTRRTVIMVQVQNEPGSWGSVRDYSPEAQKIFDSPVPSEVLSAKNISPESNRSWPDVFGRDADEFFQVWHVASYIGRIAAAGKAIYPIPLYVNGSIRDPLNPGWPPAYEVGGPNDNVFDLWKAAAPDVDILAPDIYIADTEAYLKVLELYSRSDNPLFVPETIGFGAFTRFFFAALGHGAIGYAPFGMDDTRIRTGSDGHPLSSEAKYGATARNYRLFEPMARQIARLNFEGRIQTAIQLALDPDAEPGNPVDQENYVTDRSLHFGEWDADIAFGTFYRMARTQPPPETPDGCILIAELDKGQYLLAGYHCRVMFRPAGPNEGRPWEYLIVEEGQYDDGSFRADRILNGDQTDWGLNFPEPAVLRVTPYLR